MALRRWLQTLCWIASASVTGCTTCAEGLVSLIEDGAVQAKVDAPDLLPVAFPFSAAATVVEPAAQSSLTAAEPMIGQPLNGSDLRRTQVSSQALRSSLVLQNRGSLLQAPFDLSEPAQSSPINSNIGILSFTHVISPRWAMTVGGVHCSTFRLFADAYECLPDLQMRDNLITENEFTPASAGVFAFASVSLRF